jgi:hypothetical protein
MARDAGELIDETTEYGTWADSLGAVIARGDELPPDLPAVSAWV